MALSPRTQKTREKNRKTTFRAFLKEHRAKRLILLGGGQKLSTADAKLQFSSSVLKPWLPSFGSLCLLHEDGYYRKIAYDYLKDHVGYSIHVDYPSRLEELIDDQRIDFRRSDVGNLSWMPRKLTHKNSTPHVNGVRYSFPKRFDWKGREVNIRSEKTAFLMLSPQEALVVTDFFEWGNHETFFVLPLLTKKEQSQIKQGERGYWSIRTKDTVDRLLSWETFLKKKKTKSIPLPQFSVKYLSETYRRFLDQANVKLQDLPWKQQALILSRYWGSSAEEQTRFLEDLQTATPTSDLVTFCQQWS